jgi:hypothetical protein
MERRSFLQGLFGGVTAGGLILKASPREIEAFAAPLAPEQPVILDAIPVTPNFDRGIVLYNARGERVLEVQSYEYEIRRDGLTRINVSGFADGGELDWFNEKASQSWHHGRDPFKPYVYPSGRIAEVRRK